MALPCDTRNTRATVHWHRWQPLIKRLKTLWNSFAPLRRIGSAASDRAVYLSGKKSSPNFSSPSIWEILTQRICVDSLLPSKGWPILLPKFWFHFLTFLLSSFYIRTYLLAVMHLHSVHNSAFHNLQLDSIINYCCIFLYYILFKNSGYEGVFNFCCKKQVICSVGETE